MRIAFYAPFKPLDHPRPSGDLTTALGLTGFLAGRGHEIAVASRFRARDLARRPWLWPGAVLEAWRAGRRGGPAGGADLWLTHHAYWKSPDVVGPWAASRLGLPYCVFQGIYSTKRRKAWSTRLGFELNRRSLLAARVVFANRLLDLDNLRRLLPRERLCYVAPGIDPEAFARDPQAGAALRAAWRESRAPADPRGARAQGLGPPGRDPQDLVRPTHGQPRHPPLGVVPGGAAPADSGRDRPVILSVAMFRDDVKTQGLRYLVGRLGRLERDFELVLAGDGPTRDELEALARERLPGRVRFLGRVERAQLRAVYSAADLFVFPGIRESLGMVYLEAQAAGLPVVAFDNGGIPEVVDRGVTGLLTPPFDDEAFLGAVASLLDDAPRRQAMGRAAADRVRRVHDAGKNFQVVEERLLQVLRERP